MNNEKKFSSEDIKNEINRSKDELKKEVEGIIGKDEITNFNRFAFKGRMIELSIAFVIGTAFQKTVTSISSSIIMPLVNYFILNIGKDWKNYTWTPIPGMTFGIGDFIGSFIDFFIISIVLYVIYNKIIKSFFDIEDNKNKACTQCQSLISNEAKRCPFCTSWL